MGDQTGGPVPVDDTLAANAAAALLDMSEASGHAAAISSVRSDGIPLESVNNLIQQLNSVTSTTGAHVQLLLERVTAAQPAIALVSTPESLKHMDTLGVLLNPGAAPSPFADLLSSLVATDAHLPTLNGFGKCVQPIGKAVSGAVEALERLQSNIHNPDLIERADVKLDHAKRTLTALSSSLESLASIDFSRWRSQVSGALTAASPVMSAFINPDGNPLWLPNLQRNTRTAAASFLSLGAVIDHDGSSLSSARTGISHVIEALCKLTEHTSTQRTAGTKHHFKLAYTPLRFPNTDHVEHLFGLFRALSSETNPSFMQIGWGLRTVQDRAMNARLVIASASSLKSSNGMQHNSCATKPLIRKLEKVYKATTNPSDVAGGGKAPELSTFDPSRPWALKPAPDVLMQESQMAPDAFGATTSTWCGTVLLHATFCVLCVRTIVRIHPASNTSLSKSCTLTFLQGNRLFHHQWTHCRRPHKRHPQVFG